ncbi:MAG TPA: hypothetical protein VJB08_00680 [Candidatus Nanoarchaeia archaeon]|nr:hypothetical protein [Candidatus Nanoarchaeia archaeon]
MKRLLTTVGGIALLAYFAYIEVNNAEGFFDITAILTLCAVLLILLVSTYRKEFSHFVGITLYTFGLVVLAMNGYHLLLGSPFKGLLVHEFLIGLILIANAFLYRNRGWSLLQLNVSE